jgi:hypothetical protein
MTALRVKAIQTGFYGNVRRDPDDKKYGEFGLRKASEFSSVWMEAIGWDVAEEQAKEKAGPIKAAAKTEDKPKEETKDDGKDDKPKPVKVSTETTVTPPATAPKQVSPITGKDI